MSSVWSLKAKRSTSPASIQPITSCLGIEVEGLEAQMQARVAGEAGAHVVQLGDEAPRRGRIAQARLPGIGQAVIGGGDAVGEQLPVGLQQRQLVREAHAGARHQLPLERVAMQIDHAGQDQQSRRVPASRR